MEAKGTQIKGKEKIADPKSLPCPWLCDLVPTNVPEYGAAQPILHPRKDVFVLKVVEHSILHTAPAAHLRLLWPENLSKSFKKVRVAKVGANGDRRCKMELELVTPKGPPKKPLNRIETRETQCDPEPESCTCLKLTKKKKQPTKK